MMKTAQPAASPEAYLLVLQGWQQQLVSDLREIVLSAGELEEKIKWGHLVYFCNGPALLIRAEEERVLFGFWRGKRLRELEPRLKPGGKYEMATLTLTPDTQWNSETMKKLVTSAIELNQSLGDPTKI